MEQYQTKIETLDWVKRALIKRKFPNTIEVTIIENLPFAVFINGINQYLIDEDGDIISEGEVIEMMEREEAEELQALDEARRDSRTCPRTWG